MAKRIRILKAWAIDTNDGGLTYLGIYAFDSFTKIEPWQDGCRVAVFRTRETAKKALRELKQRAPHYFPKSTVRRVVITIEGVTR